LNFPTKDDWRNDSELEYVENGLKYLAENYQDLGIYTIAMPALGCGNGGLNWDEVKLRMEKYLGELPDLDVYIYPPISAANVKAGNDQQDKKRKSELPKSAASSL